MGAEAGQPPGGEEPDIDPRIVLAAERTLLAWIRTGIALMGFGFVVARFGMFLRELARAEGWVITTTVNASTVGVSIVCAGLLVNLWASLRHRRMITRMRRGEPFESSPRGPVAVGLATVVGGAILAGVLFGAVFR